MHIRRSVEDTFAFISDLRNAPAWDFQTVDAYQTSDGPVGTGTRFRLVSNVLGYRLDLPYEILRYDPPRMLVIAGETAMLRYSDRITFAPQGSETRLTYETQLDLKGVLRLANPLLSLTFRWIGDAATRHMSETVERLAIGD